MTSSRIIIILFITIVSSCASTSDKDSLADKKVIVKQKNDTAAATIQVDKEVSKKDQYCMITGVVKSGDSLFINADYIQFLTGKAAIDAAIKRHQADTFRTDDGKAHVDVPNDYFIVNDNKKIRRLEIDKNCVFDLLLNPARMHPIRNNSLESLTRIYKDSPFILTVTDQNIVVRIKELYLP